MPTLPLTETFLLLPLLGALAIASPKARIAGPDFQRNFGFGVLALAFAAALATQCLPAGEDCLCTLLAVESWAAPLVVAGPALHLLVLAGTPKLRLNAAFVARILLFSSVTSLALVATAPWLLVAALVLGALIPAWDLHARGRPLRGYAIHMALFAGLLAAGLLVRDGRPALGAGLILAGLLVRGGIFPFHGWVPTLFEKGSVACALLFTLPLVEAAAVLRLLHEAPKDILGIGASLCLATAVYGGAMAIIQHEARRFFAYLVLSQTAMAFFGFLLSSPDGLTAALGLWLSNAVALSGLAFSLRAVEARFGELSLAQHHGHYAQVPRLAVCFLVSGLASVGFPGTINFAPVEMLLGSACDFDLSAGILLAIASMLGAVAILRAYFSLFTGKRTPAAVSLRARPMELLGLVCILLAVLAGFFASPALMDACGKAATQSLGVAPGEHGASHP